MADWVVLRPAARWSHVTRQGGSDWPVGLRLPLADAGTLLRYAMGESVCALAGPRPELVGRAVPVAVLAPSERGATPDVVLRVGASPSLQGSAPEVVLVPPATSRALLWGYTIQPLGDGPVLPYPAAAAPPSRPGRPLPRCGTTGSGPDEDEAGDLPGANLDQGLEPDVDEDDEYLLG